MAGATGLVGAAGVAVTQPVLDLFGRNPEFFIAGRYRPSQIVVFGVLVALARSAVAVRLRRWRGWPTLCSARWRVPYMLVGTVRSSDGERPPESGVIGAFVGSDDGWRFTGVLGPWYVDGANTVDAYEVEVSPRGRVLRPVGRM